VSRSLAYLIVLFSFQSIDNKQYTNSIRDLLLLPFFFFILGLDLIIGLFLVVAQQIQKIQCEVPCAVAIEKYARSVAN